MQRPPAPALRAPDRRLAPVGRRLRRARTHSATCSSAAPPPARARPVAVGRATLVADRVTYVPPRAERAARPQRLLPRSRRASSSASSAPRAPASRRWPASSSASGRRPPAASSSTARSTFAHERASFGEAVGYLPQDPLLFEGKVRENIARFRDADMADVDRRRPRRRRPRDDRPPAAGLRDRRSPAAASASPAASASASASPARSSATPGSSSSTSPTPPSTPRARRR